MLVCEGVTKTFEGFTALEDVSFTVGDASICGLVGFNGAGKTTLLKTAAAVYRPDKGRFCLTVAPMRSKRVRGRRFFCCLICFTACPRPR